jgi:serine/threonine-protein kinase
MTPERWRHIDRLFHSALERVPEERASFLTQPCGDDDSVRGEIEALIAAHEQTGEFLDAPAYELASGKLASEAVELAVGEALGHYKILGTLGAGGMGEVYLAQDSRLGRNVALKLLSATITGDAERVRRFDQEGCAALAWNLGALTLPILEGSLIGSNCFLLGIVQRLLRRSLLC